MICFLLLTNSAAVEVILLAVLYVSEILRSQLGLELAALECSFGTMPCLVLPLRPLVPVFLSCCRGQRWITGHAMGNNVHHKCFSAPMDMQEACLLGVCMAI